MTSTEHQSCYKATKHNRHEQSPPNATNTVATRKHNVSSHNEADILTRHMSHRAVMPQSFTNLRLWQDGTVKYETFQ
jgi:hypothetical protein